MPKRRNQPERTQQYDVQEDRRELIASRIRSLRQEAGLSQAALGKQVGVSTWTVCSWETGRFSPTFESLNILEDALHTSMAYLLGDSDERHRDAPKNDSISALQNELVFDAQFISRVVKEFACLSYRSQKIVSKTVRAAFEADKEDGCLQPMNYVIKVQPKKINSKPEESPNKNSGINEGSGADDEAHGNLDMASQDEQ